MISIAELNKEVKRGAIITLYQEDYSQYGWRFLCNELSIYNEDDIKNLKEITLEIASVINLQQKNNLKGGN